jgi:hypothetical protein
LSVVDTHPGDFMRHKNVNQRLTVPLRFRVDKAAWPALLQRLTAARAELANPPVLTFGGSSFDEKFLTIADPFGNSLEFTCDDNVAVEKMTSHRRALLVALVLAVSVLFYAARELSRSELGVPSYEPPRTLNWR